MRDIERKAQFDIPDRVLVVDDEEAAATELADALDLHGIDALTAEGVNAAIAVFARDARIGVVISDLQMPESGGLALLERIRAMGERGQDCEFLIVTGFPTLNTAVEAIRFRINAYISKPIRVSELVPTVVASLDRCRVAALRRRERAALFEGFAEATSRIGQSMGTGLESSTSSERSLRRPTVIKQLLALRDLRDQHFPKGLFSDPAWFMLLDLLEAEKSGKRISVSSLCLASGVSQSTAFRRVQDLCDLGVLERIEDPLDKRRVYVELTDETRNRVRSLIDAVIDRGN